LILLNSYPLTLFLYYFSLNFFTLTAIREFPSTRSYVSRNQGTSLIFNPFTLWNFNPSTLFNSYPLTLYLYYISPKPYYLTPSRESPSAWSYVSKNQGKHTWFLTPTSMRKPWHHVGAFTLTPKICFWLVKNTIWL
jgi:hypothetical protein